MEESAEATRLGNVKPRSSPQQLHLCWDMGRGGRPPGVHQEGQNLWISKKKWELMRLCSRRAFISGAVLVHDSETIFKKALKTAWEISGAQQKLWSGAGWLPQSTRVGIPCEILLLYSPLNKRLSWVKLIPLHSLLHQYASQIKCERVLTDQFLKVFF